MIILTLRRLYILAPYLSDDCVSYFLSCFEQSDSIVIHSYDANQSIKEVVLLLS